MKLKCDKHQRRVLTGAKSLLHRTGDLSACDSLTATIGSHSGTNRELKISTRETPK